MNHSWYHRNWHANIEILTWCHHLWFCETCISIRNYSPFLPKFRLQKNCRSQKTQMLGTCSCSMLLLAETSQYSLIHLHRKLALKFKWNTTKSANAIISNTFRIRITVTILIAVYLACILPLRGGVSVIRVVDRYEENRIFEAQSDSQDIGCVICGESFFAPCNAGWWVDGDSAIIGVGEPAGIGLVGETGEVFSMFLHWIIWELRIKGARKVRQTYMQVFPLPEGVHKGEPATAITKPRTARPAMSRLDLSCIFVMYGQRLFMNRSVVSVMAIRSIWLESFAGNWFCTL